jgi:hypothetical protein
MNKPSPFPGQLTKVLDTRTPRKQGLKNFYMLVVDSTVALELPKEAKEQIFGNMLEVTKKLAKVADAVDEYEKLEKIELKRLIEEAKKQGNPELILAEDSSKLEAVVEEALSQAKSALDVAVKVLEPVVGIKLHTYGEGGKDVLKALKNNVPKQLKEKVVPLIQLVEQETDTRWLEFLKKHRDDQHYKNLGITSLRANGKGQAEPPSMPGGEPIAQSLSILYVNLFTFLMDFLAAAMLIRLITPMGYIAEGENLEKRFRLALIGIPTNNEPDAKTS